MFSTLTMEERERMMGLRKTSQDVKVVQLEETDADSVDWRDKGAVNGIQNQGDCGSCWAFGSVAAMEAAHFIKTGTLLKLSEQQFVECSHDGDNNGCNGGEPQLAFKYAMTNPIMLESDYPYTSDKGKVGTCSYDKTKGQVSTTGQTGV
jgi:C1A family cysteine protease